VRWDGVLEGGGREREDGGHVSERGFGEDSQVLKEQRKCMHPIIGQGN
jgi:hypothetical protein